MAYILNTQQGLVQQGPVPAQQLYDQAWPGWVGGGIAAQGLFQPPDLVQPYPNVQVVGQFMAAQALTQVQLQPADLAYPVPPTVPGSSATSLLLRLIQGAQGVLAGKP